MRYSILVILFSSFFYSSFGQLNHTIYHTVLWEVKDTVNDKTSYILGTSHAFGNKFFHTMSTAYKQLKKSELILLQATGMDADIWNAIKDREDNPEIKKILSRSELQFVEEKFEGKPFQKLEVHELDLCLSLEYFRDICEGCSENDHVRNMDKYIEELAGMYNIPTKGFETGESIFKPRKEEYVPRASEETQIKRLKTLIKGLKSENNVLESECDFVFDYKDMELPYAFDEPCPSSFPLIRNRNTDWAELLPEYLSQQNCFIAIGWYHLRHECGLIKQLLKKGFVITPVDMWS